MTVSKKPQGSVNCEILRDVWDENGVRQPKGTRIDLPVETALDMVEAGAVQRVKE